MEEVNQSHHALWIKVNVIRTSGHFLLQAGYAEKGAQLL